MRNQGRIKKQDPYPLQLWTGSATLENTLAFDFAKKIHAVFSKKIHAVFLISKRIS
jgi:hypothetical protein